MTLTVYTFERDGQEFGSYTTQSYPDAQRYAETCGCLVVANEYEFVDSFPLDDFQVDPLDEVEDALAQLES